MKKMEQSLGISCGVHRRLKEKPAGYLAVESPDGLRNELLPLYFDEPITVGRSDSCHIHMLSVRPFVARHQCQFSATATGFYLTEIHPYHPHFCGLISVNGHLTSAPTEFSGIHAINILDREISDRYYGLFDRATIDKVQRIELSVGDTIDIGELSLKLQLESEDEFSKCLDQPR